MLIIASLAAQFLEFDSPGNTFELVCIFALTIAALIWSVGSLYSSNVILPVNVLVSTGMMLFVGGFFLIAMSFLTVELQDFHVCSISSESMTSLLYLITVGSAGWVGFLGSQKYISIISKYFCLLKSCGYCDSGMGYSKRTYHRADSICNPHINDRSNLDCK